MPGFLSPLFFLGAAAAAIPILLHLLKRQPEARVKFAAIRLLKAGPVEQTRRRRLRDLLLLALRVSALLLLALAFARPFFAAAARSSPSVTVVALDTSLSMSAPGLFERAKRIAKDAVRGAPAGDRLGVVTFSDQVHVATGPTGDRALAAAAVDAAATDAGATRYRAALAAAAQLTGDRGTIIVVTDLQEGGWDTGDRVDLPESVRVEVADTGTPPPNLALTAVSSESGHLIASVRNASPESREVRVALEVKRAGARGASARAGETVVAIGANQTAQAVLPEPDGEAAIVSVEDPGGIEGDNRRYVVLGGSRGSTVLVVTASGDLSREAFYVQQALAAGPVGAGYQVDGVAAAALGSWNRARLETYAALILTSTVGLERRGRDLIAAYTRAGGGIFVAAAPDVDGEVVADALGDAKAMTIVDPGKSASAMPRTLTPVDARHPIFAAFGSPGVSLGLANFRHVAAIRGEGCDAIARFTSGEDALLDCARGDGRALVLASDLDNRWNDLPLRPTFVPFLHEAVRYLSGSRSRQSEYIVGEQPPGVAAVPGFAAPAASPDGQTRVVAVNVDPRESDPGRLSEDEFRSAIARLKDTAQMVAPAVRAARQNEDRQHLWQYILAMALIMLIAESVVSTRTA